MNVKKLDLNEINLEFVRLDLINGSIDKVNITKLLENPQTGFAVYNMLSKKHPELVKDITEYEIAESGVTMLYELDPKDTSVEFIEKKTVRFDNFLVSFYFYKVKNTSEEESYIPSGQIAAIAFINDGDKINAMAYKRLNAIRLADDEKTSQTIKSMIDATLNEGHTRTSFGKIENEYDIPYDYDY